MELSSTSASLTQRLCGDYEELNSNLLLLSCSSHPFLPLNSPSHPLCLSHSSPSHHPLSLPSHHPPSSLSLHILQGERVSTWPTHRHICEDPHLLDQKVDLTSSTTSTTSIESSSLSCCCGTEVIRWRCPTGSSMRVSPSTGTREGECVLSLSLPSRYRCPSFPPLPPACYVITYHPLSGRRGPFVPRQLLLPLSPSPPSRPGP